ncbi:hypothetical protein C7T35_21155 [Variovorax sp. WS11]|nr:hypothetical protein C7T35_21155 [Variovorax sp. WS11]
MFSRIALVVWTGRRIIFCARSDFQVIHPGLQSNQPLCHRCLVAGHGRVGPVELTPSAPATFDQHPCELPGRWLFDIDGDVAQALHGHRVAGARWVERER